MDRKTFMRDIYPQYWITARQKIYGFPPYDRNLCDYMKQHTPAGSKVLEVAIGTGFPFADFLQRAGYRVSGVDISPALVEECRRLFPAIDCRVGDAEALDHLDAEFDLVYCFHSTAYFPDLLKAIDEMIRVTRPGGLTMFDLENRHHPDIERTYQKRLHETRGLGNLFRYAKNVVKLITRVEMPRRSVIYEVPHYPELIYTHLGECGVREFRLMARGNDDALIVLPGPAPYSEYNRLVFAIRKG